MKETDNNDYFDAPILTGKAKEAFIINDKGKLQLVYQFTFENVDLEILLKALQNK